MPLSSFALSSSSSLTADPENIILLDNKTDGGTAELGGASGVNTFEIGSKTYAIVASAKDDGVQTIDVTDPANIVLLDNKTDGGTAVLGDVRGVDTFEIGSNTYAIVTAFGDNGVQTINVTDPANIVLLDNKTDGGTAELGGAHDVDTFKIDSNTYAIVASAFDSGVQTINVTDPANIVLLDNKTDGGTAVLNNARGVDTFKIDSKTYAIVTSLADHGVQTINVTDPTNIDLLDNKTDGGTAALGGAHGVDTFVIGSKTYAIVASGGDNGVQTINVTDPENIVLLDNKTDTGTAVLNIAYDVDTFEIGSNTYAIVTAFGDNGVQTIDVTDPTNIILLDNKTKTNSATAMLTGVRGLDPFTIGSNTYAIVTSFNDNGVQTIGLNVDLIAPTPTITSTQGASGDSTNAATLNFQVDFGEAVTGFEAGDVTISDTNNIATLGTLAGSGQSYTFDVNIDAAAASSETTVTVQINAGVADDLAGNKNLASGAFTLNYDATAPTVTVTPDPPSPSNSKEFLVFEIDFSKDVQGFNGDDLQINTGSGFEQVSGTLDDRSDVDASTYNYTLSPTELNKIDDGGETITFKIKAAGFTDTAGNQMAANHNTEWTFDPPPTPIITSTQGDSGGRTSAATLNFQVDFGEAVTGFETDDVTISDTNNIATLGTLAGSGQSYTFDVNIDAAAASSETTVTVQINAGVADDLAGNKNLASGAFTLNYDATAPTVTVTPDPPSPSNSKEFLVFEIDFSKDVQGFNGDDLQINTGSGFEQVSGTLDDRSDVDASTYNYTLSTDELNKIDDGGETITFKIVAAGFTDTAGNQMAADHNTEWTFDPTPPTPIITSTQGDSGGRTSAATLNFQVDFGEAVTEFYSTGVSVMIGGNDGANHLTNFVPVSGQSSYTFDVVLNAAASSGTTVLVRIPAGAAWDLAGNPNLASKVFRLEYDTTVPVIEAITRTDDNAIPLHVGDTVTIDVQFDTTVYADSTRLVFDNGATSLIASPSSNDGDDTLSFNYTVKYGDGTEDLNIVSMTPSDSISDANTPDNVANLAIPSDNSFNAHPNFGIIASAFEADPGGDEVIVTDTISKINASSSESISVNFTDVAGDGDELVAPVEVTTSNVIVTFPAGTTITSGHDTTAILIDVSAKTANGLPPGANPGVIIELGSNTEDTFFDTPVRVALPGRAGQTAFLIASSDPTGPAEIISVVCSADTVEGAKTTIKALVGDPKNGECSIDSGADLIIWTKHFTGVGSFTVATGGGGGGNDFDFLNAPTFGVAHDGTASRMVDSGISLNGVIMDVDSFHTEFAKQVLQTGQDNTLSTKVMAPYGLSILEFFYGVPEIGSISQAEGSIEIYLNPYDSSEFPEITNTVVRDKNALLDTPKTGAVVQRVDCIEGDEKQRCWKFDLSFAFANVPIGEVFALQAVDAMGWSTTEYFNDGFAVEGEPLIDVTEMISSDLVRGGGGLIEIIQVDRKNDLWAATSGDGTLYTKNEFGLWKKLSPESYPNKCQDTEYDQISWNTMNRMHCQYYKLVDYENKKAQSVFDSSAIQKELPDSFAHEFPNIDQRTMLMFKLGFINMDEVLDRLKHQDDDDDDASYEIKQLITAADFDKEELLAKARDVFDSSKIQGQLDLEITTDGKPAVERTLQMYELGMITLEKAKYRLDDHGADAEAFKQLNELALRLE